jgi:hypothetical protein
MEIATTETRNRQVGKTIFSEKHGEFLYGDLSDQVIALAIKVHKTLGPGFVESIYEKALALELKKAQIPFVSQEVIRVEYEGNRLGSQRVDFLYRRQNHPGVESCHRAQRDPSSADDFVLENCQ